MSLTGPLAPFSWDCASHGDIDPLSAWRAELAGNCRILFVIVPFWLIWDSRVSVHDADMAC